jgi:pectinesterase
MPKNLIRLVIGLSLICVVASLFADENDLTVAADGSARFATVQAAVDAVPAKNMTPVVIRIAPGRYLEHVILPKDKPFITLRGDGKDRAAVWIGGPAMKLAPVEVRASDTCIQDLTIESTAGPTAGPMMAMYVESKRVAVQNCRILGWQDTLGVWNGALAWFHNDEIWGSVDFIYSGGTGVFDHCLITERRDTGGVVAAPSTPAKVPFGLVFLDCHLTKSPEAKNGPMSLMRPWFPDGQTAFIRCQMDNVTPAGWDKWDGREKTCRAAEYGSIDANGKPIDLSTRSAWVKRLTNAEAADYTLTRLLNGWDPAAATTRVSTEGK